MATNDDDMMNAINANAVSIDITWNILCGALVFFMQAGFAMLEVRVFITLTLTLTQTQT